MNVRDFVELTAAHPDASIYVNGQPLTAAMVAFVPHADPATAGEDRWEITAPAGE